MMSPLFCKHDFDLIILMEDQNDKGQMHCLIAQRPDHSGSSRLARNITR